MELKYEKVGSRYTLDMQQEETFRNVSSDPNWINQHTVGTVFKSYF